jgi:hypothetical protein
MSDNEPRDEGTDRERHETIERWSEWQEALWQEREEEREQWLAQEVLND